MQRDDLGTDTAVLDTASFQLSLRRTHMSFQRTQLSADRTLMSVIRTALSLISFGFTIYQIFHKAAEQGLISAAGAPRIFGVTLVILGIGMLAVGILSHIALSRELNMQREEVGATSLIHARSRVPRYPALIGAITLLCVGIAAIVSIVLDPSAVN